MYFSFGVPSRRARCIVIAIDMVGIIASTTGPAQEPP
jgi:hypothetical protein